MEPRTHENCQTWSVFVATDDLALLPQELKIKIGGMAYTNLIYFRKWIKGQVYHRSDIPSVHISYSYSPPVPSSSTQTDHPRSEPIWFHENDVVPMSLTALRKIFRDINPNDLPQDFAKCLAGDTATLQANNVANTTWKRTDDERRMQSHFVDTDI